MNWYYDSFNPEAPQETVKNAAARREIGLRKMAETEQIEAQLQKALEVAEHNGTPPHIAIMRQLKNQPGVIQAIKDYLLSRGVSPSDDILQLCMQLAYWRADHIDDVIDSYDPDNFLGFGKKAKKRRLDRLAAKLGYGLIPPGQEQPAAQPEQEQPQVQAAMQAAVLPANINPNAQDSSFLQAANEVTSPTPEQAEAEIIGREAEMESFDGEQDKLLPWLNTAIGLGQGAIAALKAKKANGEKIDLKTILSLFKKGKDAVVDTAKEIETKKTIREYTPTIIFAIAALLFIGYAAGGAKS